MIERKYLDYLNGAWKEIRDFLKENDVAVDQEKQRLFFEEAVSPYAYWIKAQNGGPDATDNPGTTQTISKIAEEYGLTVVGDLLRVPKGGFEDDVYQRLRNELAKHGYEYKKGKYAFGPKWNGVK